MCRLFEKKDEPKRALALISSLYKELRKMDDKILLVEIQLLESQVYHSIQNVPKAKASLTGARAMANTIYCSSDTQAMLDLYAGILHAEEGDYRTAHSFFYEAVEAKPENPAIAGRALTYMLLMLLILEKEIIANTAGWKAYSPAAKALPESIAAMGEIAKAVLGHSLATFESLLSSPNIEGALDLWCRTRLMSLGNILLRTNLQTLIAPYSRVQISFLAQRLGLPVDLVLSRLSQMILDKQLLGFIDQGADILQLLEEGPENVDQIYPSLIATIGHLEGAVDALGRKAALLSANTAQ
ncbi:hypothetical protein DI09_1p660 [Mitosporidium daphniae]|uniref:PCI domain-containing protein n=1 Tax=Mitosporidium daphniae TaxID=1485682 RepID=A0A098VWS8_9MICR|nr:uncharacterized protein DI09_1p660 [Mitosporidium daphniae]KGG52216.1 hypothetical protein DI09_1p660 [Mitosporidium daphniae]|eukprot:XP_013238643.1 uncharacterized protein DI09_1p660 [Mitosporidium daphniae]